MQAVKHTIKILPIVTRSIKQHLLILILLIRFIKSIRLNRGRYMWAILLIQFAAGGGRSSFGVFFLPLLTEFGWTRTMTSGAASLAVVLSGLLGVVMGRLNDRFGPRLVVTASSVFLGLGYLLMSRVSGMWQLYLFYGVIIGIGMSGIMTPLMSTIARWFAKRRGVMSGLTFTGSYVGIMIMPPVANWLISIYSWRSSYIILGIMILVVNIFAAQFLKRDPSKVGLVLNGEEAVKVQSLNLQPKGSSLQQAIKTRQFWMLVIMNLCAGFSLQTILVHIVPHAIDLGITPASAAAVLTVIAVIAIPSRIIMGHAGDRIGYKPAYAICFTLMAVPLFGLGIVKEPWMLFLFVAIFAVSVPPLLSPMIAQLFGLRSHGAIYGSIMLGWFSGSAIGPVLAGHLFDIVNSYQPAWLICGALAVVAVFVTWLLKPTLSFDHV